MKIMLAYDNSRNAKRALQMTLDMFKPLQPLIILIGVVEDSLDTSSASTGLYEQQKGEFRSFLRAAADEVGRQGLDAEVILAEGDAQARNDIIYLEKLPVFNADGTVKA